MIRESCQKYNPSIEGRRVTHVWHLGSICVNFIYSIYALRCVTAIELNSIQLHLQQDCDDANPVVTQCDLRWIAANCSKCKTTHCITQQITRSKQPFTSIIYVEAGTFSKRRAIIAILKMSYFCVILGCYFQMYDAKYDWK